MKQDGAKKFDGGKSRLELLPFKAVKAVADVQAFGANKYGDHNWRQGMKWSRLLGAMMRHIFDFATGVDKDEESGLHPLAHAACDALFLLEYAIEKVGEDDRFRPSPQVVPREVELIADYPTAYPCACLYVGTQPCSYGFAAQKGGLCDKCASLQHPARTAAA